jgi:hypothetical protein
VSFIEDTKLTFRSKFHYKYLRVKTEILLIFVSLPYRKIFKVDELPASSWTSLPLKMEEQVVPKLRYGITNLRCVRSRKNADGIRTAVEA